MKNQKARIGVLILLAAAALLAAVYYFARPQPVAGAKTVTVEVIHGDGSIRTAELHTDETYLGPALLSSEELGVEGENGPYGLYIQTVDGETASDLLEPVQGRGDHPQRGRPDPHRRRGAL